VCLSPRNSVAAVRHLLRASDTAHVVCGAESSLKANVDVLLEEGVVRHAVDMMTLEQLQSVIDGVLAGGAAAVSEEGKDKIKDTPRGDHDVEEKELVGDPEEVVLVLHSSGSTGAFPKLIRIPQRYFASLLANDWLGMEADDVLYLLPPFYHAYGLSLACNGLAQGRAIVVPSLPSWPPTKQMLVKSIDDSKANVLCVLPWLLENLVLEAEEERDEEVYSLLARMRAVNYAAAALNARVGDLLFKKGVKLMDGYGSSEAGIVAINQYSRTDCPCIHWNHLQCLPSLRHRMEPFDEEKETGLFRLVVCHDNPMLALGMANTKSGDYDMNDLLERVPCRDGRECYVLRGRVDDVIVHSTGEKTSPLPIEHSIRSNCAAVKRAVVVGQQRLNTALLVELRKGFASPPPNDVVQSLREAVRAANQNAPQHSRIMEGMIYVLKEGESIPCTDKGSVKRRLAEQQFKTQIDALYQAFTGIASPPEADQINEEEDEEAVARSSQPICARLDEGQIADWLEQMMLALLVHSWEPKRGHQQLSRSTSIFAQGFDSLLATQFYYQHLCPAFSPLKLPPNILYQHPDIDGLASHLMELSMEGEGGGGGADHGARAENNTLQQAESLYKKYLGLLEEAQEPSRSGAIANAPYERAQAERVVLTGCTGSLGVFLVRSLLQSPRVGRVYALVRAGGDEKEKLVKALQAKLLDASLAYHEKITIWACELDQPRLGLAKDKWEELHHHATSIIHNAWLLNFEANPMQFESTCIRPSVELMRLCCATPQPKQFIFVSSIAAAMRSGETVEEAPIEDQSCASMTGYGQSKLLTERLAVRCAARFHVPVTIARVGQIAGDTLNGIWNTSEHLSLMIKATETLGAMPDRYMSVDALPVDIVASTITSLLTDVHHADAARSLRNSGSSHLCMAHLVNPIALPWLEFLRILQSPDLHLHFQIVGPLEWLQRLENSTPDPVANPIKKLQGFFVEMYAGGSDEGGEEAPAEVKFETKHTAQLVPSMRYNLEHSFWLKVIGYWREIGFLQQQQP